MKSPHFFARTLSSFLFLAAARFALAQPGDVDPAFNASLGTSVSDPKVYNPALQPDGRIIVSQAGASAAVRLNPDGSADPAFAAAPSGDSNNVLRATAILPNGQVLIGGGFSNPQSVFLRRFNADGTPDPSFDAKLTRGTAADPSVACLAMLYDVRILVGGGFTIAGTNRINLVRLQLDGTLDTSFDPQVNGFVSSIAVQADGKAVIGGAFTSVHGTPCNHLARLNLNGTLDSTFNPGIDGYVYTVALQADGKILIGGYLLKVDGGPTTALVRLNPDGTPDTSFATPDFFVGQALSIAIQTNGEIQMADFDQVIRLDANGNNLGTLAYVTSNGGCQSLGLQADGKVVVGGSFTSINSAARNYLARVENEVATQALSVPDAGQVRWERGGASPETQTVTFELSIDGGGTWTPLGFASRIAGGWELTGQSLPVTGTIRARARTTTGYGNGSSSLLETVRAYVLPAPPTVTTRSPYSADFSSVKLDGTVNPNGAAGAWHFEYGADPALADASSTTPVAFAAGTADLSIGGGIDGLAPASMYYCRAVATTANGTTQGEIVAFTSAGKPGDLWRYQHFGSAWQGISFAADSDADGVSNLAEYAFGGDPLAPDSAAILPQIDTAGGHLRITFTRDRAHTDLRELDVQASSDLITWTGLAECLASGPAFPLANGVAIAESAHGVRTTVQVTDNVPIGTQPLRALRVKMSQ